MAIIGQAQATFVDLTDPIRLESNMEVSGSTIQFLSNNGYNPSFSSSKPLTFTPYVYQVTMGEVNLETNAAVKNVRWYHKIGAVQTWTEITTNTNQFELVVKSGKKVQLKLIDNVMGRTTPSLEIKCEVDYQEKWMPQIYTETVTKEMMLSVQGDDGKDSYTVVMDNETHAILCNSVGTPSNGEIGASGRAKTSIQVFKGATKLTPVALNNATTGQYYIRTKSLATGIKFEKLSDNTSFYLDNVSSSNLLPEKGTIELEIFVESTNNKVEKAFTFSKVKEGTVGQDAYVVTLTNDSHVIPTDSEGNNGNYTGADTTINLYEGSKLLTNGVTYSETHSSSITGTLTGNRYVVTNLSDETGYVDLKATYKSVNYTRRFTLTKSKGGGIGQAATAYWMIVSASALISPKIIGEVVVPGNSNIEFMEENFEATEGQTQFFIPEITAKDDLEIHINNLDLVKNVNYTKTGATVQPTRKIKGTKTAIRYNPSQLTLTGKSQTGTGEPADYACRFRIEETTDNSTWTIKYTSNADETTKTYTPSNGIKAVKCTMYKAGGVTVKLDEQTVPVLKDGVDGESALAIDITGGQIFNYDSHGTVSPQSVTLTANGKNFTTSATNIQWQCSKSGQWANLAKGTTLTVTHDNSNWEDTQLKVRAYYVDRPVIFDEFTLYKVRDGKATMVVDILTPHGTIIKNHDRKSLDLQGAVYWSGEDKSDLNETKYKWEKQRADGTWIVIRDFVAGTSGKNISIKDSDIPNKLHVRCTMQYSGQTQFKTIMLQDLTDPHQITVTSTAGYNFKNGEIDTHVVANITRAGIDLDIVNMYSSLPTIGEFVEGDIVYLTTDDKYYEKKSNTWTKLTEAPSITNGKSEYTYKWYKLNNAALSKTSTTFFAGGKIIRITNRDVNQVANFRVTVEDKY